MRGYLYIIIFLLSISLVTAFTNYTNIGSFDNQFQLGSGEFNGDVADNSEFAVTADTHFSPLVADLDGDGINEIVVLSDDQIKIFRNKELDVVDSFSLPASANEIYSNTLLFDIDDDGYTEIIQAMTVSELIVIVEYNGTAIKQQTQIDSQLLDSGVFGGDAIIKCGGVDNCIIVGTNTRTVPSVVQTNQHKALFFNSTNHSSLALSVYNNDGLDKTSICLDPYKSISYIDYDNDGIKEYIYSAVKVDGTSGNDEQFRIYYIEPNGSGVPLLDNTYTDDDMNDIVEAGDNCDDKDGLLNQFTNVVMLDVDGAGGNGIEGIYAISLGDISETSRDYTLKVAEGCSSDGCVIGEKDDHPETCDLLGNCPKAEFLSNVFIYDIFDDPIGDYCVWGLDFNNNDADFLCGSQSDTHFGSTTLEITLTPPYNLTNQKDEFNSLVHTIDEIDTGTGDLREILTAYGILQVDRDATPSANIIFNSPESEGAYISVDAEKSAKTLGSGSGSGAEDILVLTDTNLIYIDDGISNGGALISNITYDPCVAGFTIKQNSTLSIDVIVDDIQDQDLLGLDPVSLNITVYKGDANEQKFNYVNQTSGTTLPFTFELNKTIVGGQIELLAWDAQNENEIDVQTQLFTVGQNGIEEGDVDCSIGFAAEEGAVSGITGNQTKNEILAGDENDNFLINGMVAFSDITNIPATMGWIFLMIIAAIVIFTSPTFFNPSQKSPQNALIGMVVVEIFMLILGVMLGFISFGILLTIIIISVTVLGVWIKRHFMNAPGE